MHLLLFFCKTMPPLPANIIRNAIVKEFHWGQKDYKRVYDLATHNNLIVPDQDRNDGRKKYWRVPASAEKDVVQFFNELENKEKK
jgi:hypothetical protein